MCEENLQLRIRLIKSGGPAFMCIWCPTDQSLGIINTAGIGIARRSAYSFIHSFIYSFIRSCIHSFIHLFIYSYVYLFLFRYLRKLIIHLWTAWFYILWAPKGGRTFLVSLPSQGCRLIPLSICSLVLPSPVAPSIFSFFLVALIWPSRLTGR